MLNPTAENFICSVQLFGERHGGFALPTRFPVTAGIRGGRPGLTRQRGRSSAYWDSHAAGTHVYSSASAGGVKNPRAYVSTRIHVITVDLNKVFMRAAFQLGGLTNGCIRVPSEAMYMINDTHRVDPLEQIEVTR